jgi:hypothetical protein
METTLYDNAMQVVPLILIALFLEDRGSVEDRNARSRRWERLQDQLFILMGGAAFMVSMLVVSGVVPDGDVSLGIVIATLGLAIGLLFSRIWRRFERTNRRPARR